MIKRITIHDSRLLITALGANGAFSTISGITMALAPNAIAEFLGLSQPGLVLDLGIMLILFGAALLFYFARKRIPTIHAIVISLLDLAWVIGSVAVVFAAPDMISAAGIAAIVVVAIVVLTFLELQAYALWQLGRQSESSAGVAAGTNRIATE